MLMIKTAGIGGMVWGAAKKVPGAVGVGLNLAGKGVEGTYSLGKGLLFGGAKSKYLPGTMTRIMGGMTVAGGVGNSWKQAKGAFAHPSYESRIFMN